MKKLIRASLALLGLEVRRLKRGSGKYFNTGLRTPLEENTEELYDAFYSDAEALEAYYQKDRRNFYRVVAAEILRDAPDLAGGGILDVGCGVGYLLAELAALGAVGQLTGSDFSLAAVETSRKQFPNMSFFQHDLYDPIDGSYDLIVCSEVLEHLERPERALSNMRRALRPKGGIVMTIPNGRIDTSNEHINFWSLESWGHFLRRELIDAEVTTRTVLDQKYLYAFARVI